jgi:hypothetical protein
MQSLANTPFARQVFVSNRDPCDRCGIVPDMSVGMEVHRPRRVALGFTKSIVERGVPDPGRWTHICQADRLEGGSEQRPTSWRSWWSVRPSPVISRGATRGCFQARTAGDIHQLLDQSAIEKHAHVQSLTVPTPCVTDTLSPRATSDGKLESIVGGLRSLLALEPRL